MTKTLGRQATTNITLASIWAIAANLHHLEAQESFSLSKMHSLTHLPVKTSLFMLAVQRLCLKRWPLWPKVTDRHVKYLSSRLWGAGLVAATAV